LRFLLDNNLSPKVARALAALGYDVVHLRDERAAEAPDEVWMAECARRGWAAISYERYIQAKPSLRQVLEACGLTILFLPRSMASLDPRKLTIALLHAWPKIVEAAESARPGRRCFSVRLDGRVEPLT